MGKSSWIIGWVLNAITRVLTKKAEGEQTHTHTGCVKTEGEIGVMSPEAKESQQPPEAQREKEGAS